MKALRSAFVGLLVVSSWGCSLLFEAKDPDSSKECSSEERWLQFASFGDGTDTIADFVVHKNCDVTVCGSYSGTLQIGTEEVLDLTGGNSDTFVATFSPSGEVVWATTMNSDNAIRCRRLALTDTTEQLYVYGEMEGSATSLLPPYQDEPYAIDFINPNIGTDLFLTKYDTMDALGRPPIWTRLIRGNTTAQALDMAILGDGVAIGGLLPQIDGETTTALNGGKVEPLTFAGSDGDALLAKIDADGEIRFAHRGGSNSASAPARVLGVAIDAVGSTIVAVGETSHRNIFSGCANAEDSAKSQAFIAGLDAETGACLWSHSVKAIGELTQGLRYTDVVTSDDAIYVSGETLNDFGELSFDEIIPRNTSGFGGRDALLVEYASNGAPRRMRVLGGPGSDRFLGIALSNEAEPVAIGTFESGAYVSRAADGITDESIELAIDESADAVFATYEGAESESPLSYREATQLSGDASISISRVRIVNGGTFVAGRYSGSLAVGGQEVLPPARGSDGFLWWRPNAQ
tara:strand:+ start:4857 stop:6413 length:1557 start_codon:yes stop_codon:yes gene_type:complete